MQNSLYQKALVFAAIVLFVRISVFPISEAIIVKKLISYSDPVLDVIKNVKKTFIMG